MTPPWVTCAVLLTPTTSLRFAFIASVGRLAAYFSLKTFRKCVTLKMSLTWNSYCIRGNMTGELDPCIDNV